MSTVGARVYAGLDLGATPDLSAPGDRLAGCHGQKRSEQDHAPYAAWENGRTNSSTRSANSSSPIRLLITDFETFRRVATAVTIPASTTLMNVRISSKRQVHRSLLANTRCVWHVFTSCRETLRHLDGHRRVLRSVLAARRGRPSRIRRVVMLACSIALVPSASDRA